MIKGAQYSVQGLRTVHRLKPRSTTRSRLDVQSVRVVHFDDLAMVLHNPTGGLVDK